jgi:hypothetical protein
MTMNNTGTPIAWPLRLWFVAEVLFSLGAVLTIALFPASTRTNWSWEVKPVVMAAVLGAFYISAAPLTLLPVFARRWEMVRVVVLPTALFTAVELLATLLHWSKFSVSTLAFAAWFLSYILPPPIFLAYYVLQQRRARKLGSVVAPKPLPLVVRAALLFVGGLLTVLTISLFIFPQALIAVAPWSMTPLTARVFVGFLVAVATLMLSMARENDRRRVLLGVPVLLLMLPAVTLQIARFPDEVNFLNVVLYALYAVLLVAFALGVILVVGDWRQALS